MDEESYKNKLRERAKQRLHNEGPAKALSEKETSEIIEELSIHQEELNIQNEELQRTQVELEAARAKYFELYDLAPVGYVALTPELIIKESNLTASNMLGIDRKKLLDKGLSSFVPPSSQDTLYFHYRLAAKGAESRTDIVVVRRKDGSEIQVQLKSDLVRGDAGSGFRSILTDVTELKGTEYALVKSEAKYRGLFENTHEGVSLRRLIYDEHGNIADAVILDANRAALKIHGARSINELKGEKYGIRSSPELKALAIDVVKKLKATGGSITKQVHFDTNNKDYIVTAAPYGRIRSSLPALISPSRSTLESRSRSWQLDPRLRRTALELYLRPCR